MCSIRKAKCLWCAVSFSFIRIVHDIPRQLPVRFVRIKSFRNLSSISEVLLQEQVVDMTYNMQDENNTIR